MAGIHTNTVCPSCGNKKADYFYDSHDREISVECGVCDYRSAQIMPVEFELKRRGLLA